MNHTVSLCRKTNQKFLPYVIYETQMSAHSVSYQLTVIVCIRMKHNSGADNTIQVTSLYM